MKSTIKITGIKEAISDYRWANRGGDYSAEYGYIMLDCKTGEVWTDSFCDLGHSWRTVYHDDCIIDLARYAQEHDCGEITIRNARRIAEQACNEYADNGCIKRLYW